MSGPALQKHAYSNILKILQPKMENFQIKKKSDIFSYSCSNDIYPCKPQFYYIKVGFKGVKLYRYVFVMSCNEDKWILKGVAI